jgi:decaprenylphospho-beta-D-erythro-pentofuranosid-2-ulose 2-reductase
MKNVDGDIQSVLVLGGGSEIGLAIARRLAGPRQATIVLASRHPDRLDAEVASLRDAGAGRVETVEFDADETESHEAFVEKVTGMVGDLDVVVFAFGLHGDQAVDEAGGDGAVRVAHTNYVGAMSVGLVISRLLKAQGHGTMVVLSTVAAERIRSFNFIYGSSKAGLDAFAEGLGHALVGTGANVLLVRVGGVPSPMTAGTGRGRLGSAVFGTTADAVGAATASAVAEGREKIWVPSGLRWVFVVIRHLPTAAFRRLPF